MGLPPLPPQLPLCHNLRINGVIDKQQEPQTVLPLKSRNFREADKRIVSTAGWRNTGSVPDFTDFMLETRTGCLRSEPHDCAE